MMLELVDRLDEVTSNCATMASYLHSETVEESNFARSRIANGACFLIVDVAGERSFFPSRFLGYKDNSIEKHLGGSGILDGKHTNPTISQLLGVKLTKSADSEGEYLAFCAGHGIRPSQRRRSYWDSIGSEIHIREGLASSIFAVIEGQARLREIRMFQRSAVLVARVKAKRMPTCECCTHNFENVYGEFAKGYIECHHLDPLSKRAGKNVPTTEDDVALLCANCHRMVHRTREGLTLGELRAEMKKAGRAKRA